MAKLVLTAENYAFGPIGKLLYVADLLKNKGHKLIFAGFGTSLQLAKKFPFDEIHEIDTDNPKSNSALQAVISQSDALISSMDLSSVIVANRQRKIVVWLDCLFWFWDDIPEAVFGVDLYIKERSLDDTINDKKYGAKIKNLISVGPIIGNFKKLSRKKHALISLGGGQASRYYQVGKDSNYPFVIVDVLLKHVRWSGFEKVLLATSESIVTELRTRFPTAIFDFTTQAHDKFLEKMSQSQILLTTPGLITAQAAFYSYTPTIFIPASNDSQYLQLEQLRSFGLAPASVGLVDFMPKLNLLHIPVQESTKLMLLQLRELEQSPDIKSKIGTRINELIKNRQQWSKDSVDSGKKFIAALGGNGVQSAANQIIQLLSSKGF